MTKKPKCPTLDEVTESLKILGVDQTNLHATVDDRVLEHLVKKWKVRKDKHDFPRMADMARELDVTSAIVRSCLVRLKESKRVFLIKRGIYVPNMVLLRDKQRNSTRGSSASK